MRCFLIRFWGCLLAFGLLTTVGCKKDKERAAAEAGILSPAVQQQIDPALANVNHEATAAMHRRLEKQGSLPDNVDQLVGEGYIKKLPALPPGKVFFINTNNLQVEIVDQ